MTTIASKPRSARAAASEAASVTQATEARKKSSGNASGERVAKGAQARRRARAAEASENGSQASSNGRSTRAQSSNGGSTQSRSSNGRSTQSRGSNGKGRTTGASKPKAAASRPSGSASKPKAAAGKPKGSASKPKSARAGESKSTASKSTASKSTTSSRSKPKANSTSNGKTKAKGRSTASLRKPSGSSRSVASTRTNGSGNDDDPKRSQDGGENPVTSGGKHLASALFSSTQHRPKKHPIARALAKRAAKKTLKTVGRKSLGAGGEALRSVADSAGTLGRQAMRAGMSRVVDHRPPVQASVDVAAPISVVWSEWMTFGWFTEGLHNIEEVERDGDELRGRVVAPHERDWHAEIVDEREQQAFAWRSDEGTDCAGLVTFHQLSDRLTRIEADLDVLPTNPGETFLLSLPVPGRRAERVLQMFKAHVEFINPDVYEDEDSDESESDEQSDARAQSDDDAQSEEENDGDREDAETD